jgi:FKBP-type peptidyl-prolyl cis-trans isomerase SlyD
MKTQVVKNMIVTLAYKVTDTDGVLIDDGQAPLVYLHGGYDDIFPMIEEAMEGKCIGDSVSVTMEPDDAFGEYDDELIEIEPRSRFPSDLQVGTQFEGTSDDEDDQDPHIYRVTDIHDDEVVLDANHPLAGMALVFNCTVTDISPASADMLKNR